MALSKSGLSDFIYGKLNSTFKVTKKSRPSLRKLSDALADAVITYVTENAEVTVTTSTPYASVLPGVSLPGTGKGTVD
jgi:hypothetical protein